MRRERVTLGAALAIALATLGIWRVQPGLAADVRVVKKRDDVVIVPPPKELRALSFGYRTAGADLMWAKLVLEYGLHWQDRRAFPEMPRYAEGVLALDPEHPTLFRFLDTMLLYRPGVVTEADVDLARTFLERGTAARPQDPDVWMQYGQFLAFLAPSFIKDEAKIERWRKDGALAMTHAVELGAKADLSLAASTLLSKAGERAAAVRHLERAYVLTDDPEERKQIRLKLQLYAADEQQESAERAAAAVDQVWRRWPFMSRSGALLLGPRRDPAACAGPASFDRTTCARDWAQATRVR
ncbi:MAG: hypothetical protein R3B36_29020 [Polyangiaceae bacterium]